MKILLAASEAVPYAKTGGLADVIGALGSQLRASGVDARLIMPLYKGMLDRFGPVDTGSCFTLKAGVQSYDLSVMALADKAYFVRCDELFGRDGLYGDSMGEFTDNATRYVVFCRAVLETCLAEGFTPDVIHCNDWQTALVPLYLRTLYADAMPATRTLMTLHNMGYQGTFAPSAFTVMGLPRELFNCDVMEYFGQVNFLKAGIAKAHSINAVSSTYAREIMTAEYGFGLEGVLAHRTADLSGITNGIDTSVWDPARDSALPHAFSASDLSGKALCKRQFARDNDLANPDAPLLGIVGRLANQKGFDLVLKAASSYMFEKGGCNLAVLGDGDEVLKQRFLQLKAKWPGRLVLHTGYDEELAHRIYAASDIFLITSHYEPCGLTQMISMRYGTVPVARATGGIVDTVENYDHLACTGTGFLFSDYSVDSLVQCIQRALCVYSDNNKWQALLKRCMAMDFSWSRAAARYIDLYEATMRKVA